MHRVMQRNNTSNLLAGFSMGSRVSEWKMRKKYRGIESEMNRWPYQTVLCLVFNLDSEREAKREHDSRRAGVT